MTRLLCCAVALAIFVAPAMAQQGEGTAADFTMTTGVDLGLPDANDKYMTEGSALEVNMQSPGGAFAGAGAMLLGDLAPVSFDIQEFGVIGTGQNRFVILDGITALGPTLPAAGAPFIANFIIPASSDWDNGGAFNTLGLSANDWGLFLQGFCESPTGLFGLIEVSETIKHEVDTDDLWRDDCAGAVANANGLSDADLGVSNDVNTNLFTNTTETNNGGDLATTTAFTLEAPGAGIQQQAADAFVTFTATGGGLYNFSLCNSDFDTALYLIADDCTTPIIMNDDNNPVCGPGFRSDLNVCLTAGQTVVVGVDGFGTADGRAELIVNVDTTTVIVDSQDIDTGDLPGGEIVNFTGCNLNNVTVVTIDGVPVTFGATPTMLQAQVPAGAAGTVDIAFDGNVVGTWTYVDMSLPSFSECSTPALFITTGSPIQDTLTVAAGAGATIAPGSMTVDLDLTHTFVGDLDILLTSPAATVLSLWDSAGGSANDLIFTMPGTIHGVNAPDGAGDFSEFDGEDPNGIWTIDVTDNFGGDDGDLNMWCVNANILFASATATSTPALFITTGSPVQDTLNVVDNTTIGSMTLDLDLTHTFVGDLDVLLTSPALTVLSLWDSAGGSANDLVFTMPGTIHGVNAPDGAGDFSEFGGESTAGNWVMDVIDNFGGDDGNLNSWTLNFN